MINDIAVTLQGGRYAYSVLVKGVLICCLAIFRGDYRFPDIEELHEATIEILFGFSCLTFAVEGNLPVFDVGQGALRAIEVTVFVSLSQARILTH